MLSKLDCTGPCGNVIEFGSGYGTFTIPAAQQIQGTLYALDIELDLLQQTQLKANELKLNNIHFIHRDFLKDGSGLPDCSMGYAMLFNILHIEDPIQLLMEAYRVLRPGGKLGIIHWRNDIETPRGPSKSIRPSAIQCQNWAESVGFDLIREESLCCCSWHWGLVMQRR